MGYTTSLLTYLLTYLLTKGGDVLQLGGTRGPGRK